MVYESREDERVSMHQVDIFMLLYKIWLAVGSLLLNFINHGLSIVFFSFIRWILLTTDLNQGIHQVIVVLALDQYILSVLDRTAEKLVQLSGIDLNLILSLDILLKHKFEIER